jgi:methionyl-tRNA formyltransferase
MTFGFLSSGILGYKTIKSLFDLGVRPSFLFTDRGSVEILKFATENSIPVFVGNPRNMAGASWLQTIGSSPDLIFSINYIFLVDERLINYPKFGCLNIHGSLLPKYRGRAPHVWAIINNESQTGITVHYIDGGCDTGPIVYQETINITKSETGGGLLALFEQAYPRIIFELLAKQTESATLRSWGQNEELATFFEKRTPEDGRINWGWQRERIYNWIRALAKPYPGAFSMYDDASVIFDWCEFSEYGFNSTIPNGTILEGGNRPIVKTPNGAVKLVPRIDVTYLKNKIFL